MRLTLPFQDRDIYSLFESVLPDFVLAFAFFTSISYAVLGKQFGRQRPAVIMSASIGFALALGLVWWERSTGFSVKDLGPIAIGFAVIVLAFVMYQSIRQIGGSWSGAAIALGASILVAKLLGLNVPIDPEIMHTVVTVALIVGILMFLSRTQGRTVHSPRQTADLSNIRHDMSDLYRGRQLSNKLTGRMRNVRKQANTLNERPQDAGNIVLQLKKMLPAEGYLTEKMAQLRAKAHKIRNGHIARLEESRRMFASFSPSAKKAASAELATQYNQLVGIDLRLERLDKAVAENERRIVELNRQAQEYTAKYDHRKLLDCLKAGEKLQRHNSRLLKLIQRIENQLSAIVKKVAQGTKEVSRN